MSVRNLDALFAPRSVAVIGVSPREGNLGALVLRNLQEGGFPGTLWALNRHSGEVHGVKLWPGVAALPAAPDLAVVCTPPGSVPELIAELAGKGTRAAIVITAGLKGETEDGGSTLEQAMLDAARPTLMRILGPNCLGALVPAKGLNASFAPGSARPGPLAFVTQSGALATAMLDWANGRGIGFSHFISMGDSADVDFGDVLDYLASDPDTRAILLYMESVKHARKFMSAARAAARNKPVIVVKAGRAPEGARAAASHTGALAGSDAVFDAAARRAGMVRVRTLEELFDAAETLARASAWQGERLAIVTNGGGAGVLAADALSLSGGTLAELSPATLQALDRCLPANWPRGNPVDIIGDAPPQRYRDALEILQSAPEVDGVLFMHAPTAIVPATAVAEACLPLMRKARKPVLSSWLGGHTVQAARRAFSEAGVSWYPTPERAIAAWQQLVQYHRGQQALLQLPDAKPRDLGIDAARASSILQEGVRQGRGWLDEASAKEVLLAYGIPCVPTRMVRDADEAVEAACEIGFPVVLKVVSQGIVHKSDVGGVVLNIPGREELRAAMIAMRQRIARMAPHAHVTGFAVEAMARRPGAQELILGISGDAVFGPVLLFGAGGTRVEIRKDTATELPPLTSTLAADMVARTRVGALLGGYRGEQGVDRQALTDAMLRLSQLASDQAAIEELDINPLLADARGVLALDARIKLRRPVAGEASRLALRPYPAHLEEQWAVGDRALLVRPIRPEDGARMSAFYAGCTASDLRLRFFLSRRAVPRSELARYCQIDYEREMAFIALDGDTMVAEVRAVSDPDNVRAEFAIQVAGGWQRRGIGLLLMHKMLAYLRGRGTQEVSGTCLEENRGMAALARRVGFAVTPDAEGTLSLRLQPLSQEVLP
jgi:acetyltransferase